MSRKCYSNITNNNSNRGDQFFQIPPNLQLNIAPRSNGFADMCPSINYNMPALKNLAAPVHPVPDTIKCNNGEISLR